MQQHSQARSSVMAGSAKVGQEGKLHAGGSQDRTWLQTARAVLLLWWAGLKDGICVHRCIVFFVHDHRILVKTGQCFALNGVIFLGSILLWDHALSPGIRWLLHTSLHTRTSAAYVDFTHTLLCAFFGVIWLVPVYLVSFPLSCVWYQEIAEMAYRVSQDKAAGTTGSKAKPQKAPQQQDLMVQVAQELYRVVLFAIFFLQTCLVGLLPWLGPALNFLLLSWLNALYSFDYKWSLTKRSLQERIHFFERHWAFFAGFGSVCTLATIHWPFFSGAAILAMVYPLFILIACDSDPLREYKKVAAREKVTVKELHQIHLPIFSLAIQTTSWIIARSPDLLQAPQWLWRHRLYLVGLAVCLPVLVFAVNSFQ